MVVRACLHLVRSKLPDTKPQSIGSGVLIQYKTRYFLCTVEHFSNHDDQRIGLITGKISNGQTELYYYGDFSYITQLDYDPDEMDSEDLIYCFDNPHKAGQKIDVAFKEVELFENIIQEKREFKLDNGLIVNVEYGGKAYMVVTDDYEIDTSEQVCFYGRIRPNFNDGKLEFEEALYWGLPIILKDYWFVRMDLGAPIRNYSRFRGCSGGPIIDSRGHLIGLVTHGDRNVNESGIYGLRVDRLREWIDKMYFQEPISKL